MSHANALKRPLRVKFVHGGEEGVDQGGLQKEMFEMAAQQLFDPVHGNITIITINNVSNNYSVFIKECLFMIMRHGLHFLMRIHWNQMINSN
jgi:hypothetical protein